MALPVRCDPDGVCARRRDPAAIDEHHSRPWRTDAIVVVHAAAPKLTARIAIEIQRFMMIGSSTARDGNAGVSLTCRAKGNESETRRYAHWRVPAIVPFAMRYFSFDRP